MNAAITFLIVFLLFQVWLVSPLHDNLHLNPHARKIYHYELVHPEFSKVVSYRSRPMEITTRLPFSRITSSEPAPLVPDILNHLFQQVPKVLKEVAHNFITDQLFTPNVNNEPAATSGQLENYRKDLKEIAMEEEREQNNIAGRRKLRTLEVANGKDTKLYVHVNSGLYNYNYTI